MECEQMWHTPNLAELLNKFTWVGLASWISVLCQKKSFSQIVPQEEKNKTKNSHKRCSERQDIQNDFKNEKDEMLYAECEIYSVCINLNTVVPSICMEHKDLEARQ